MNPLTLVVLIGLGFVVFVIYLYNRFVALTNRVKEAWSDIEVQLKRRYDLIPNLVETVKGYVTHEKETLAKVTEARVKAMGASTVTAHNEADTMLSGALKSLFAVAEAYPDLKANQNFVELQRELADTENKVQAARRFYNSVVQELNTAIQSFPGNIVAGNFGFKESAFFELGADEAAATQPVKVHF